MDESEFRGAREAMTPRPCAFENAMLAGACGCSLAARRNIAEREAVACASAAAREECAALRALLQRNSAFALKLTHAEAPLPHAKQMKLECGGLQGLARALAAGANCAPALADVHALVRASAQNYDGFENLPYSTIVQSVAAYQIRRRRPQA